MAPVILSFQGTDFVDNTHVSEPFEMISRHWIPHRNHNKHIEEVTYPIHLRARNASSSSKSSSSSIPVGKPSLPIVPGINQTSTPFSSQQCETTYGRGLWVATLVVKILPVIIGVVGIIWLSFTCNRGFMGFPGVRGDGDGDEERGRKKKKEKKKKKKKKEKSGQKKREEKKKEGGKEKEEKKVEVDGEEEIILRRGEKVIEVQVQEKSVPMMTSAILADEEEEKEENKGKSWRSLLGGLWKSG